MCLPGNAPAGARCAGERPEIMNHMREEKYRMNELILNVKQNPGYIELNFDEIEKALDERLAEYKGAVFTEESKKFAKAEVADLRKFKRSLRMRGRA